MRGLGKKFDAWYITVKDAEKIEVMIYSRKDSFGTFHFTAVFKAGGQDYSLTDTNPVALKTAVQNKIKEVATIPWKDFIHLTFRNREGNWGEGSGISLRHRGIRIAKLADGRTVSVDEGYSGYQVGEVEVGENGDGEIVGVIPRTPENEAAVENLCHCIDEIGKRILSLLRPNVLEDTMAKLARTKALPEPKKEE